VYRELEPILYERLTWEEAAFLAKETETILITTGTIEQHGPHSSMDVDAAINYEICKRVSAKLGVPLYPQIMPGISQSHGFPGVVWIRPETWTNYLNDIVESLIENTGFKNIVIVNGHMWNQGAVASVRDRVRTKYSDVRIRTLNWWNMDREVYRLVSSDCPLGRSLHGNIGETSAMLAIDPEHQDMEKAIRLKVDNPEFEHFWDYREEQITRSGVMGAAATESSAELGEEMIQLAADKLSQWLEKAMREPKLPLKNIAR
jgi:creatinine amidohydrolase